jgi:tyrosinase
MYSSDDFRHAGRTRKFITNSYFQKGHSSHSEQEKASTGPLLRLDFWMQKPTPSVRNVLIHNIICNSFRTDYSYPELVGVKVDIAAVSPQERALARKKIATYYGFDPQATAKRVATPTSSWKHLPVPKPEDPVVPDDHTVVPHFRTFAVHVKLPEHAYNRSYSFQLHHTGNAHSSPQLVGTVTVFARPDHSPCKACAARREAGSVIRGMIPIPSELIDSTIKSNPCGESPLTFDQTLAHIKGEFIGKLVDANGIELAKAEGGQETPNVPEGRAASGRVTPVEISLVSTAVAEHVEHKDRPVYLLDWQNHDGVFNVSHVFDIRAIC